MSLPSGISTCVVTFGRATSYLGNDATISGTLSADRTVVHAASGVRVGSGDDVVPNEAGFLSFAVPHVDQAGFIDGSGNSVIGWLYVLTGSIQYPSGKIEGFRKPFSVLVGQETKDLDLVPDGPVLPSFTAPSAVVTSVNGETGAVTVDGASDDAIAALVADDASDTRAALSDLIGESAGNLTGTIPVNARIDIVTAGKAPIVSKETYLPAMMTITGVPGVADLAMPIQVRGRGNYTWGLPKKPYKVKLASKVSLMGWPPGDDYALLANHTDPSKINNALAFALGAQADGLDWTPRSEFAHLYLNGVYDGLYQLTETVKRGPDRVAIDKAGTTGLALTGGYMLEGDHAYQINGDPGFTTTEGVMVIFDDPDGANSTQANYIVAKVQEFEDALFDDDTWLDPTIGYARFVDRDSFIEHYFIEELSSNQEGFWGSSQRFFKTRDTAEAPGKFHMGPLWDFDIAFGSVVNVPHPAVGYYARPGAKWVHRMFSDPAFAAAVEDRWTAMVDRLEDPDTGYAALIDGLTARVAAAALADHDRWDYQEPDWFELAEFKKDWLAERIAWLNVQFIPPTEVPGQVTGLTVGDVTDTTVALTWTMPSTGGGTAGYLVEYRVVGAGSWSLYEEMDLPIEEIVVVDLDGGTDYEFRVAATNTLGTGTYSTTVAASTTDEFDPTQISGLGLWLDANTVTGAPGAITSWPDLSGNGRHSTSVAGGPTYVADGIATGKPAVLFDGINDAIVGPLPFVGNGVTMFMVADRKSVLFEAQSPQADNSIVGQFNGGMVWRDGSGGTLGQASFGDPAGGWHLYSGFTASSTYTPTNVGRAYVDGVEVSAMEAGANLPATTAEWHVGAQPASSFFAEGAMAEGLFYDRVLTPEERAQVEAYLQAKWGTPALPA